MESTAPKVFVNTLLDNSLDHEVLQHVIKTHARESITLMNYGNLNISSVNRSLTQKVEFSEAELSPFHKHDIECTASDAHYSARQPSINVFTPQKMDFADIQSLLIHSFSPDEKGRRPYPSAGGLYPVEPLVFLFSERVNGFSAYKSGCYHFRPLGKKLQLIQGMDRSFFFKNVLHDLMKEKNQPCFSILYMAVIDKAIFKYRYRGYRHAVMEAGSMYQRATQVSDEMSLRTTVWSGFSEQQIMHALHLDHTVYMPLTMQFFGYGD